MAHILAIEPDAARSVILRRLVKESLNIDVMLVGSADEAIAKLAEAEPDLILTSSLLAPGEDERVTTYLRLSPTLDHLPVLTIPPLVEKRAQVPEQGLLSRLLPNFRNGRHTFPTYDFSAVAARIEDALEQSKSEAEQNEWERPARVMLLETNLPSVLEHSDTPESLGLVHLDAELKAFAVRERQARAHRWNGDDLPWLNNVKLTWGAQLRLLNISRSGLLVESGIRFTLGNRADFQIEAAAKDLIVKARVVRSEVASEQKGGEKYIVAAVFDNQFETMELDGYALPPKPILAR